MPVLMSITTACLHVAPPPIHPPYAYLPIHPSTHAPARAALAGKSITHFTTLAMLKDAMYSSRESLPEVDYDAVDPRAHPDPANPGTRSRGRCGPYL